MRIILTIILPLFCSGCFSALNEYGDAWSGGKSSVGSRVLAGGLDVVTSPIQVPLIAAAGIADVASERKLAKKNRLEAKLTKEIEADPSIGLRDQWDNKSHTHSKMFTESFSNDRVKYTPALLEMIYEQVPEQRDYLFRSKACTPTFLAKHFDEAYDRCLQKSYGRLASIVANPNTPLPLVKKVARSKTICSGAVLPAQEALKKRSM